MALLSAGALWIELQPFADLSAYWNLWPVLIVLPVSFAFLGLYPAAGVSVVQEFRAITLLLTAVSVTIVVVLFLTGNLAEASRGFFALAMLFTITAIPLSRALIRHLCAHRRWWGLPAVVFGAGKTAEMVVDNVVSNPGIDLKVMACFDDAPDRVGASVSGVPVIGRLSDAISVQRKLQATYAIVAMPGIEPARLSTVLQAYTTGFPHVVVVPNVFGMTSVGLATRDIGGVVALYNKQNLLMPHNRVLKRVVDALLLIPLGFAALPVIALCALLVYLVDRGNPFYTQKREGQGGESVHILKLRTMRTNADAYLDRYLSENPDARAEWNLHFKLKDDPRILPGIGRFLRRTSLDELPQLWNILRGQMSFVGPRPFPIYHLDEFSAEFRRLRGSVIPGLTGYWQVTDRSDADLRRIDERRHQESLIDRCMRADAPREMMSAFFGLSRHRYARLRALHGPAISVACSPPEQ